MKEQPKQTPLCPKCKSMISFNSHFQTYLCGYCGFMGDVE